ncbi:MAG: iron-sulfur cluster assembly scaffold protein [Paracoccaceae bacterium]|nr:iron-sulfur cluster assembly scaffold protein [Paracoccaceae bacterium]
MSSDTDLIKLYSTRILALAADIPALGRLDNPDATVMKRSPLCGSTVTVDIGFDGEKITDFAQDVKACALGQAAASVVGEVAIGRTETEVISARDQLLAMLKSNGPIPSAPFEGLEVLIPAREYKNRHASIMLVLEAMVTAISETKPS